MDHEGFSADARLLCQFGNYLTDYFSGAESKYAEYVPAEIPKQSNRFHGVDERDVARLHSFVEFPKTAFTTSRVKLTLATNVVPGWSAIDAVQLVGTEQ